MTRTISIEAGPRTLHATGDGVGISNDEDEALTIDAGDIITVSDETRTPDVATALVPSEAIIAAMAEDAVTDPAMITDDLFGFDASNTMNGSSWVWAASVDDPRDATLVPSDFAWVCTVDVSSDWGGGWRFQLLYGSGYARLTDEEDGAETDAVVVPRTVTVAEALVALAGRVNNHDALSSADGRRFSLCKVCAEQGIGSADLEDGEECWTVNAEVGDQCAEEAKSGLLNALWTPCADHRASAISYFGQRWVWIENGWTPA